MTETTHIINWSDIAFYACMTIMVVVQLVQLGKNRK